MCIPKNLLTLVSVSIRSIFSRDIFSRKTNLMVKGTKLVPLIQTKDYQNIYQPFSQK